MRCHREIINFGLVAVVTGKSALSHHFVIDFVHAVTVGENLTRRFWAAEHHLSTRPYEEEAFIHSEIIWSGQKACTLASRTGNWIRGETVIEFRPRRAFSHTVLRWGQIRARCHTDTHWASSLRSASYQIVCGLKSHAVCVHGEEIQAVLSALRSGFIKQQWSSRGGKINI